MASRAVPTISIDSDDEVRIFPALPPVQPSSDAVPVVVLDDEDANPTPPLPAPAAAVPLASSRPVPDASQDGDDDDFIEDNLPRPGAPRRQTDEVSRQSASASGKVNIFQAIRPSSFQRKLRQSRKGTLEFTTTTVAATLSEPQGPRQEQRPRLITKADLEYSTAACSRCSKRMRKQLLAIHEARCLPTSPPREHTADDALAAAIFGSPSLLKPPRSPAFDGVEPDGDSDVLSATPRSRHAQRRHRLQIDDEEEESISDAEPSFANADQADKENAEPGLPLPKGFVPLGQMDFQDMSGFMNQFSSRSGNRGSRASDTTDVRTAGTAKPRTCRSGRQSAPATTRQSSKSKSSGAKWKATWVGGKPTRWRRMGGDGGGSNKKGSSSKSRRPPRNKDDEEEEAEAAHDRYPTSSDTPDHGESVALDADDMVHSSRSSRGTKRRGIAAMRSGKTRSRKAPRVTGSGQTNLDAYLAPEFDDVPHFDGMMGDGLQWEGVGYANF